jgi:two-component system, LuxR family, response regulator FixJ
MVYLIDDDESVRRAFTLFLNSANIDHQCFGNASDFLTKFKPDRKDLLVLDLNLPGMNGIDLLKKLIPNENQLSVIVVTANDETQSREYCRKFGVKAFLRKPVDAEALLDIISYHISAE